MSGCLREVKGILSLYGAQMVAPLGMTPVPSLTHQKLHYSSTLAEITSALGGYLTYCTLTSVHNKCALHIIHSQVCTILFTKHLHPLIHHLSNLCILHTLQGFTMRDVQRASCCTTHRYVLTRKCESDTTTELTGDGCTSVRVNEHAVYSQPVHMGRG